MTLVEILVVLVIIGIVSGVAVLQLGAPAHVAVCEQLSNLRALLLYVEEQAVFRHVTYGVNITSQEVSFYQQRRSIVGDSLSWVRVEDENLNMPSWYDSGLNVEPMMMQSGMLQFFDDGTSNGGAVAIIATGVRHVISVSPVGTIKLTGCGLDQ